MISAARTLDQRRLCHLPQRGQIASIRPLSRLRALFQRSQRAAVPRPESAPRDDVSGGRAGEVGDGFSAGLPDGFQGGDAPASPGPDESDAGAAEREPAAAGVA